jgi:hypothetical protein
LDIDLIELKKHPVADPAPFKEDSQLSGRQWLMLESHCLGSNS